MQSLICELGAKELVQLQRRKAVALRFRHLELRDANVPPSTYSGMLDIEHRHLIKVAVLVCAYVCLDRQVGTGLLILFIIYGTVCNDDEGGYY